MTAIRAARRRASGPLINTVSVNVGFCYRSAQLLRSGVTARSAQNFSAGRPDPRLPTTIGLSQPLATLPLRQDAAVRPGSKERR